MATGILLLAGLLMAGDVPPADVVPMNYRNFQIPFHIDPAQRDKIKEVILFASTDQGLTWNQVGVASPDKSAFAFYAPTDGLYWFNIGVVDVQGNREPPDIYQTPPHQKVLVDTLKPNLRITAAERQGDEIVVGWEVQEDHPDLATLKLEYRTPDAPTWMWYLAPVSPAPTGQARFRFLNSGPVMVRMQVADQAGNLGVAQTEVPGKQGAVTTAATTGPAGTPNSAGAAAPSGTSATPLASAPPGVAGAQAVSAPPQLPPASSAAERLPPIQPASLTQADPRPSSERGVAPPPPPPIYQQPATPMPDQAWGPPPAPNYPQPSGYNADNRYLATNAYAGSQSVPATGSPWPRVPVGPAQITNSAQVTLDYEVTKVGPSGVGSVELYLTQDEGRTWQRYADDPKLKPPMTVNLPGEGVFGLRLVVRSRAGLGQRPPQSGEVPQMRVEVDTTPPLAKIFPPQPDPRRRDSLLLTWNASDPNLTPNPITLQWSERPEGPWQVIAADLTNSGRYTWQLTQNLPYRVYLRLLARDAAGNVGMDETPEAVLIDLHEPEGQIKGIIGVVRR
jgi:hypothetical protein